MLSLRVFLAALGVVFGILWATIGIGWAAVAVLRRGRDCEGQQ